MDCDEGEKPSPRRFGWGKASEAMRDVIRRLSEAGGEAGGGVLTGDCLRAFISAHATATRASAIAALHRAESRGLIERVQGQRGRAHGDLAWRCGSGNVGFTRDGNWNAAKWRRIVALVRAWEEKQEKQEEARRAMVAISDTHVRGSKRDRQEEPWTGAGSVGFDDRKRVVARRGTGGGWGFSMRGLEYITGVSRSSLHRAMKLAKAQRLTHEVDRCKLGGSTGPREWLYTLRGSPEDEWPRPPYRAGVDIGWGLKWAGV